ncbi:MAG TPA: RsbRD N-terminal domain-containing protein [Desulfatiglandales bacterium]|nr:RsbRD N-terminal domain-containing protein [Desulfatiglandales bacterium]
MNLQSLLLQKKSTILERWYHLILGSYPSDTGRFLKKHNDRFDNPVAYEFRQGIEGIYEALLHGMDRDSISYFLDRIVSIRALQEFPPSAAIAFIFLLKKAIRDTLKREIRENGISDELTERESRIDGLALLCFDAYMKRREKIYEIKVNEIKNRAGGLLRRACGTVKLEE